MLIVADYLVTLRARVLRLTESNGFSDSETVDGNPIRIINVRTSRGRTSRPVYISSYVREIDYPRLWSTTARPALQCARVLDDRLFIYLAQVVSSRPSIFCPLALPFSLSLSSFLPPFSASLSLFPGSSALETYFARQSRMRTVFAI